MVCDRRGERRQGTKNDEVEADELSERVRRGGLRAVYHSSTHHAALKELTRTYQNLVEDSTRVMLRLKALFRARALLGVTLGAEESEASWSELLEQLLQRGSAACGW